MKRRPIVIDALALFIGSYLAYYIDLDLRGTFLLVLVSLGAYLAFSSRLALILLVFFLGAFNMQAHESSQVLTWKESGQIIAIIEEPLSQEEDYSSYRVRVRSLDGRGLNEKADFSLAQASDLEPGDVIKARVQIKPILHQANAKLFNYQTYARISGVYTRLEAHKLDYMGHETNSLRDLKLKFHSYVREELSRGMRAENATFVIDVLTGSDLLDARAREDFSSLGLAHLLAISGLHISILAGILVYISDLVGIHKYLSNIIITLLLGLYVYLIGLPASAIRAFVMFAMASLATMLKRGYDGKKALALAVILMVLANPYRVFDTGLVLSVIATLALLYREKIFNTAKAGPLMTSLQVSLAVNLFLFPFLAYNFNSIQPVSLLANMLVVPAFNLLVSLAALKLILGLAFKRLSLIIGLLVNSLVDLITKITSLLLNLDFLSISLESSGLGFFVLYYFCLTLYIHRYDLIGLRPAFVKGAYRAWLIQLAVSMAWLAFLDPLTVNFIYIGQGDAILIEYFDQNLLMDTGGSFFSDRSYTHTLKPFLEKNTSSPLPVIISHDDVDHTGNLPYLIEDGFVRKVYTSAYYKKPYQEGLKEGDKLALGQAQLRVLYDGQGAPSSNDSSLIILLDHHGNRVLFTGDAEGYGEQAVMDKDIGADVLKVGHHGSRSSSHSWFLDRVDPSQAVISAGRDNSYGHPHQEVVDRLKARDIDIYRTDLQGQIKLVSTKLGYWIDPYLPRQVRATGFLAKLVFCGFFTHIYYDFFKKLIKKAWQGVGA